MSRQKKAPAATRADSKNSQTNSNKPVSKYKSKQYQRTAIGMALLAAMEGQQ